MAKGKPVTEEKFQEFEDKIFRLLDNIEKIALNNQDQIKRANKRLDEHDKKLTSIDSRLDGHDKKLASIDKRLDSINGAIDRNIKAHEERYHVN